MLRALDFIIGLKLICHPDLGQVEVAKQLGLHQSQVSNSIKILLERKLFWGTTKKIEPNFQGWEELLPTLKYLYPANLGGMTIGMPTAYAAPPLNEVMHTGNEPIPVWACGHCKTKGVRLDPLYPSIPDALTKYPDQHFYELLSLVDALRVGTSRDLKYSKKLLNKKLKLLEKERK